MAVCDRCENNINEATDEAICFEGENGKLYLCSQCVNEIEREVFSTMNDQNLRETNG
tara:strand:+ start:195 stop:365 length:171 start_codon:yes stop_codon:yes gene_type:complete